MNREAQSPEHLDLGHPLNIAKGRASSVGQFLIEGHAATLTEGSVSQGTRRGPPRGTCFARMNDGKAVEFNSYPDVADLMMQLGFMPEM